MRSSRWRPAWPALAAVAAALIVACGSTAPAAHHPPRRPPEVITVRGSLLQVRSPTLTVQGAAGASTVQVTFAALATPIYAVTDTTTSAIQPGSCAAARGERDATGTVMASAIVVTPSVDDTCPAGTVPPPPAPPDPSPSPLPPSPAASPSSSPVPGPALLTGQVLSLGGGAALVEGLQGDPQVVLLPPGAQVFLFQPSGPSALVIPSCVVVDGTRSRHAIAARKIVDWPPGTQC